mmetsp:Transcript_66020/g.208626  ORF Transcript_66020/g.208626 Transcript_66020/m.208626 type:complete len:223 (-) Transcript_66020:288-956(-)
MGRRNLLSIESEANSSSAGSRTWTAWSSAAPSRAASRRALFSHMAPRFAPSIARALSPPSAWARTSSGCSADAPSRSACLASSCSHRPCCCAGPPEPMAQSAPRAWARTSLGSSAPAHATTSSRTVGERQSSWGSAQAAALDHSAPRTAQRTRAARPGAMAADIAACTSSASSGGRTDGAARAKFTATSAALTCTCSGRSLCVAARTPSRRSASRRTMWLLR